MAIKPILFNTDMVRAILDGCKTQTRRLVKPSHKNAAGFYVCRNGLGEFTGVYDYDDEESMFDDRTPAQYQVGDVLWVRETWNIIALCDECNDTQACFAYKASEMPEHDWRWASITWGNYEKYMGNVCSDLDRWRPSIHMPKAAARLFLKVTDVRIERLQDMSAEDCSNDGGFEPEAVKAVGVAALFGALWNRTIKADDLHKYGWDANPWVWVYEFERCEKPEGWGDE